MKTTKIFLIPLILFFLSACYAPTLDLIGPDRGPDICTGSEPLWIAEGDLHTYKNAASYSSTPIQIHDGTIQIEQEHFVLLFPLDGEAFVDLAPGDEVHVSTDWITTDSAGVRVLPYERRAPNRYRFTPGTLTLSPTEWQDTFTADETIRELAFEVQPVDPTKPITLGIYVSVSRHCSGP